MKFKLPWQKRSNQDELIVLEKRLDAVLSPVNPDPGFVKRLRAQIAGQPKKQLFGLSAEKWQTGLLIFGGLASAALMMVAGFRALVTLLGALGLIRQVKKQIDETVPVFRKSAL